MSKIKFVRSIIKEYGFEWIACRILYDAKLKTLHLKPAERLYERQTAYPKRLDIFDISIHNLKEFILTLDENDKKTIIATADKACNGVIKGFSLLDLNYGNPIDWHRNPITGKHCNENKKWFKIPDFDKELGDIKTIWEASRFSHFVAFARAYLLTDDVKYYEAFSLQLKEWLKKNHYSYGANFKCGQECSLRIINALLAYTVFREAGVATDLDASNVKDLIDRCYRKILSNFFYAYKCIKNNHTISELMGMIVGAWCCDDKRQLKKAYSLLDKTIGEQFSYDGGYIQFSFNYQRLALQDLEVVMAISEKTNLKLNENSFEKIKNSAMLMYQCQDGSGDMPNYGSNDGALVFPVTSCGYRDFRPVINTIYALTTGKQLYSAGKHQEELLWFSGRNGIKSFSLDETCRESSQFRGAGLYTLRDEKSWVMLIANNYHSRPAHMDQNHIDLWIDNVNVFCDSGTYSYASDIGRQFIKNSSHNTAVVTNNDQMNLYGPFMVYNWSQSVVEESTEQRLIVKVVSPNGYSHIRSINRTDTGYEIVDFVDKFYRLCFHTMLDVVLKDEIAELMYGGKLFCKLSTSGKMTIEPTESSLYYLTKRPSKCISIEGGDNAKVITKIVVC